MAEHPPSDITTNEQLAAFQAAAARASLQQPAQHPNMVPSAFNWAFSRPPPGPPKTPTLPPVNIGIGPSDVSAGPITALVTPQIIPSNATVTKVSAHHAVPTVEEDEEADGPSEEDSGEYTESQHDLAMVASTPGAAVVSTDGTGRYVDITHFLNMPQSQAARKLNIPTSTLSKRWKEAVRNRKWPYRSISKLDKEIMTLLHNIPQSTGSEAAPLPPDIEATLGHLLRRRQEELKPVVIRI